MPDRRLLAVLPVALFSLIACNTSRHAHAKRLPGAWQAQPVTVDGSNKDWPSPYPQYDDKAFIGYAVSNDKENLYITAETGDQATQLKILRGGLTVWIDKAGGKNEVTAINYPIPVSFKNSKVAGERGEQSLHMQGQGSGDIQKQRLAMSERIKKQLDEAAEFSLEGFKACNLQFPIIQRDSCGIIISMAVDEDNELVWEAVVPLSTFYYKGQIDKRDIGKPVSICFETTGLPRPEGQSAGHARQRGGGFRPSIGMGMGGGLGVGMGGQHNAYNTTGTGSTSENNMEPMYKSTKTWKTFGLAFKE